jgi:hypothetical protein
VALPFCFATKPQVAGFKDEGFSRDLPAVICLLALLNPS